MIDLEKKAEKYATEILPDGNTRINLQKKEAYLAGAKELKQKFVDMNKNWYDLVTGWVIDYKELEKENENFRLINKKLQCCGNCKKYKMLESQVPLSCLRNRKAYSCCEDWEMNE